MRYRIHPGPALPLKAPGGQTADIKGFLTSLSPAKKSPGEAALDFWFPGLDT